jgi:hypothetical protein
VLFSVGKGLVLGEPSVGEFTEICKHPNFY